jgi:hypothetical protein
MPAVVIAAVPVTILLIADRLFGFDAMIIFLFELMVLQYPNLAW